VDDEIDINFDMRSDANGRDPDAASLTLRRYHQLLWSKPLPNGYRLQLRPGTRGVYLRHESDELGVHTVASDTIVTSHRGTLRALYQQMPPEENLDFHRRGFSIGGSIIFPVGGATRGWSINQHRGMSPRIRDRFDLTLECIRRFYRGESSPLELTLDRYRAFFDLFVDFSGYVTFFHLQDLVRDTSEIAFLSPFDGFDGDALPRTLPQYAAYRDATLRFVAARNQRIRASQTGGKGRVSPAAVSLEEGQDTEQPYS